jgi:hypothetical protein
MNLNDKIRLLYRDHLARSLLTSMKLVKTYDYAKYIRRYNLDSWDEEHWDVEQFSNKDNEYESVHSYLVYGLNYMSAENGVENRPDRTLVEIIDIHRYKFQFLTLYSVVIKKTGANEDNVKAKYFRTQIERDLYIHRVLAAYNASVYSYLSEETKDRPEYKVITSVLIRATLWEWIKGKPNIKMEWH